MKPNQKNIKRNVGVYIATANRPVLFDRALGSLASQTKTPAQISVFLNGSEAHFQDYFNVLEKYSQVLSIEVTTHNASFTPGYAKNSALQKLDTDLCTGLDDDDFFTPNRIENFLNAYEELGAQQNLVLYSNQVVLKRNNANIIKRPLKIKNGMLCKRNRVGNQAFGSTELFKKCTYKDIKVIDDYDFAIRLYEASKNMVNTNKFDYIWDQSHNISRVSSYPPELFASTYDELSAFYSLHYGPDYNRFKYGKLEYKGVNPDLYDFASLDFYRFGFSKYCITNLRTLYHKIKSPS